MFITMIANLYLKIRAFIRHKILYIDDRPLVEIAISNGLKIGRDCNIQSECIIDWSHCWLIEIGDRVTLAPRVHILAHDASTKRSLGYTALGGVKIGNDVFVGAGTIILPNVEIGDRVVIGAGSIVSRSIPSNSVAVGNPARVVGSYEDYVAKRKKQMEVMPCYDESYTIGKITTEKKLQMQTAIKNQGGFVV